MKKIFGILLSLCLLVSYTEVYADESSDFDEFMTSEFVDMMEGDYTSLHFGLRDYESLGIKKPEVNIGSASWSDYEDDLAGCEESLSNLLSFDYEALDEKQKHEYETYKYYLERMIELNQYPYHDFYFLPNSGIQDNIITTMTEFVFYEKQDFDDYLLVLDDIKNLLDDGLEITDKQVKEGYFMTDGALDTTLESIDRFTNKKEDNELIIVFNNNVDVFEGLSDKEKEDYKAKNKEIVLNSVVPAYEKLGEKLEDYRGSRKYGNSVYDLPDGKEYYESFVKFKSSMDATPEELLETMNEVIDSEIRKLYEIIFSIKDDTKQIELSDPTDILEYLRTHMDEFPKGPEVTYKASYLDPSVANEGIIAYYMQPPVDDIVNNVIKINGGGIDDDNSLYATLAHEGFPGHLFQITWYLDTKPNLLNTQLSTIGYTEGWGMYAEDRAHYTMPLEDENLREYLRLNTSIGYIMNAAVDVGVNGLGWKEDDIKAYLEDLGLNGEGAKDLYDFVCDTPGIIVPYGYGLAEFLKLREKAEYEMGDNFNAVDFNTVLLTYGDRPFKVVEADVNKYIETGRVESPKDPNGKEEFNGSQILNKVMKNLWIPGLFLLVAIVAFILSRRAKNKDPFGL